MGLIIDTDDFTDKFAIAQNNFSQLSNYISRFERTYLYKLLGKELADLLIADLTSQVPTTQRFIDIFEPMNSEVNGIYYQNNGMKQMLLGFIWFEFQRYDKAKSTIAGTYANVNENSREVGFGELNLYGRYNQAVDDFKEIQRFCSNNFTDYPEYIETELSFSHWSI